MRILHLIASVDRKYGGPVEGLYQQAQATVGEVVREVVSMDLPNSAHLAEWPIPVHALGVSPRERKGWLRRLARFGYTPKLTPWLQSHAGEYDAVVVHGLWNFSSVAARRALPRVGVAYFVFVHGMLDPWFRRRYPIKHLAKQIAWWMWEGTLLSRAHRVFFTSEEECQSAKGQFVGYTYRSLVVPYGAGRAPANNQAGATAFRASIPALGDRPYLLFLSRIHPKKGCDLLIEAFADIAIQHPELDLVMAGPDETGWVADLKLLAGRKGVAERVHWPGLVVGAAKWGAFAGADAFVLPSHQENFGIVVAEAMGSATPVLITNKVNIWREVEADEAGLVESDDKVGVTNLLKRFLGMTQLERQALGERARTSYDRRFDFRETGRNLVEIIRTLIDERSVSDQSERRSLPF